MSRNSKFLFGAILGAIFGLAFAPKKGSELRKEIKSELDKGGNGSETLQKNAQIIGEDISQTTQELYNDPTVQKHIKDGKKEGQKLFNKAKKNLKVSAGEIIKNTKKALISKSKEFIKKSKTANQEKVVNKKKKESNNSKEE